MCENSWEVRGEEDKVWLRMRKIEAAGREYFWYYILCVDLHIRIHFVWRTIEIQLNQCANLTFFMLTINPYVCSNTEQYVVLHNIWNPKIQTTQQLQFKWTETDIIQNSIRFKCVCERVLPLLLLLFFHLIFACCTHWWHWHDSNVMCSKQICYTW